MKSIALLLAAASVAATSVVLAPAAALAAAPSANITGTWTTSFESQVGTQTYTYTGQIVSADEIKFKRDVARQGGEEFTARRQ